MRVRRSGVDYELFCKGSIQVGNAVVLLSELLSSSSAGYEINHVLVYTDARVPPGLVTMNLVRKSTWLSVLGAQRYNVINGNVLHTQWPIQQSKLNHRQV